MRCTDECNVNLRVGTKVQHCTACHQDFSGDGVGEKHRYWLGRERRCLTVSEMEDKGMQLNPRGVWTGGGENPFSLR